MIVEAITGIMDLQPNSDVLSTGQSKLKETTNGLMVCILSSSFLA